MGRKTVSDLLTGLAVVFTALLLVAAVLSWRASFVSPEAGNFWASIGLLMPVILLLNLAALVWWLLLRRWGVALMPVAALALNLGYVSAMIQLPDFDDEGPHDIRVATLCARAVLRSGAGLVTAACPFAVLNTIQAQAPCAMAKVVSDGAELDAGAAELLTELAKGKAALAIGPGLGRTDGAWLAVEALVRSDTPKVIDADALFLLAKHGGGVGANTVLTPHPGEMARLCDTTVQAVLAAPVEFAQQLAADLGACVLLKGATTIIAQGEDVAMNIVGCDGMGTGGSGDVLTGVIASLMAQGMSTWDAARVGAFYHGRAGETAQAHLGARGMTAWDVCDALRVE